MRVVSCIDLTTLAGDDTKTNITRLCYKAAKPIREDLLKLLKLGKRGTCFQYFALELLYSVGLLQSWMTMCASMSRIASLVGCRLGGHG